MNDVRIILTACIIAVFVCASLFHTPTARAEETSTAVFSEENASVPWSLDIKRFIPHFSVCFDLFNYRPHWINLFSIDIRLYIERRGWACGPDMLIPGSPQKGQEELFIENIGRRFREELIDAATAMAKDFLSGLWKKIIGGE